LSFDSGFDRLPRTDEFVMFYDILFSKLMSIKIKAKLSKKTNPINHYNMRNVNRCPRILINDAIKENYTVIIALRIV